MVKNCLHCDKVQGQSIRLSLWKTCPSALWSEACQTGLGKSAFQAPCQAGLYLRPTSRPKRAEHPLRPWSQCRKTWYPCATCGAPFLGRAHKSALSREITGEIRSKPFLVRVPVLSLSRYSTRPSSSGNVLVRTIVSGISESCSICRA